MVPSVAVRSIVSSSPTVSSAEIKDRLRDARILVRLDVACFFAGLPVSSPAEALAALERRLLRLVLRLLCASGADIADTMPLPGTTIVKSIVPSSELVFVSELAGGTAPTSGRMPPTARVISMLISSLSSSSSSRNAPESCTKFDLIAGFASPAKGSMFCFPSSIAA